MLSLVGVYNFKCLTCHKGGTLNGYILASYFLWDALDAIINFTDAGYVAHGIACFTIFFLSYVRVSPFSFFVILIPPFFFLSRNHLCHTTVLVCFYGKQVLFS